MRLLVTRAKTHAEATAARLRALGDEVDISPLLNISACTWQAPEHPIAGLVFTSANAVHCAGPALARWLSLPVFVVGAATAQAARQKAFTDVRLRDDVQDAQSLFMWLASQKFDAPLLHLTGRDQTATEKPAGLAMDTRVVYAAELVPQFTKDVAAALHAGRIDAVLLYSPRTAEHFAALYDALGLPRAKLIVAAMSQAIAVAAGTGWRSVVVAGRPAEAALFDALHLACPRNSG